MGFISLCYKTLTYTGRSVFIKNNPSCIIFLVNLDFTKIILWSIYFLDISLCLFKTDRVRMTRFRDTRLHSVASNIIWSLFSRLVRTQACTKCLSRSISFMSSVSFIWNGNAIYLIKHYILSLSNVSIGRCKIRNNDMHYWNRAYTYTTSRRNKRV